MAPLQSLAMLPNTRSHRVLASPALDPRRSSDNIFFSPQERGPGFQASTAVVIFKDTAAAPLTNRLKSVVISTAPGLQIPGSEFGVSFLRSI